MKRKEIKLGLAEGQLRLKEASKSPVDGSRAGGPLNSPSKAANIKQTSDAQLNKPRKFIEKKQIVKIAQVFDQEAIVPVLPQNAVDKFQTLAVTSPSNQVNAGSN